MYIIYTFAGTAVSQKHRKSTHKVYRDNGILRFILYAGILYWRIARVCVCVLSVREWSISRRAHSWPPRNQLTDPQTTKQRTAATSIYTYEHLMHEKHQTSHPLEANASFSICRSLFRQIKSQTQNRTGSNRDCRREIERRNQTSNYFFIRQGMALFEMKY